MYISYILCLSLVNVNLKIISLVRLESKQHANQLDLTAQWQLVPCRGGAPAEPSAGSSGRGKPQQEPLSHNNFRCLLALVNDRE